MMMMIMMMIMILMMVKKGAKISDIRMMLSRLGNILTKNDRKKIKKELYEIKKKKNLSNRKKKRLMIILLN